MTGVGVAIIVGGLWDRSHRRHEQDLPPGAAAWSHRTGAYRASGGWGTKLSWLSGLALGGIGAAFMFGAWGIILALDIEPATTLAEGIPGDVFGEVVIGSALAVAASIVIHIRTKVPNT